MNDDRPSTRRIVLTFVGWAVGLLAVLALIVAISTALAPKTPSDKAPGATQTATPSVAPGAITTPTP